MSLLHEIGVGFAVALLAPQLLAALCGAMLGTLLGALDVVSAPAAIALLLPAMARLDATESIVLLAAVWYGSRYGAAVAAILLKAPADSVAAGTDGGQMARQGRGHAALASAWLGTCVAGGIGALVLAVLALPLAEIAFRFGPAEYFSLIVLALVAAVAFSPGSFVKGVSMLLLGLLLAQAGTDAASSSVRFAFGLEPLAGGIGIVALAVGLLAVGEMIARAGSVVVARDVIAGALHGERPRLDELREAWPSILRGSALGAMLGLLPGRGASFAASAAYAIERRVAVEPRVPFGRGAVQGVAGP
ncbi:MAG TPA: tripartite tricarboxylate transporter permease, partial [Caldimonas sp.]|nr:tripartite tricarboxylate transporter permease [Caldimonas sp.]